MIAALFSFAICHFSGKSLRTRMYVGIVSLRSSVPVRTLFENNETGGSNYALRKKTEQATKKNRAGSRAIAVVLNVAKEWVLQVRSRN